MSRRRVRAVLAPAHLVPVGIALVASVAAAQPAGEVPADAPQREEGAVDPPPSADAPPPDAPTEAPPSDAPPPDAPAEAPPSDVPSADAPMDAPPEATPEVSGEPADGRDVDVITSAGRLALPAEYQPSIVLEGKKVTWDPRWKEFDLGNWVATGAALAIGFGALAIPPTRDRWTRPTEFDWEARRALLPETVSQRKTAADASDILLTLSVNTLLVDTLIVTWWGHDADTVAYQMALINVETLAFNTALWGLVAGFASRERPYGREICGDNDDERPGGCGSSNRFRSFYSGHASTSFAAAAATCMHHAHLPLYGGGFPDALACGFSLAVAGGTATLRVVGDRHWLSDVMMGAAMGTFSGLAVPYFLHYRGGNLPEVSGDEISVNLVPMPTGAMLTGVF